MTIWCMEIEFHILTFYCSKDKRDYALKQIEGTGISMSACREIAVRMYNLQFIIIKLVEYIRTSVTQNSFSACQ